jgi:hypothetical protein
MVWNGGLINYPRASMTSKLLIKVFIAHYQGNDGVMILMSTNGFHTVLPNR